VGGDVKGAVEHAATGGAHQGQPRRALAGAAALRLCQPPGIADQHRHHPRGQSRGQRGAKRHPPEQPQDVIGIDGQRVQRPAQDHRERAQAQYCPVGGGFEGYVGVAQQRQVAQADNDGEAIARDQSIDHGDPEGQGEGQDGSP
jgi:hypothetical protein